MKALTEDLITFAHLGRSETALVALDLTDLVDRLVPELKDEIHSKQGRLSIERPLGKVVAHELFLRQALANLITNALKFAIPGRLPEVVIRSEQRGQSIRLRVEDHGIGISRAQQEKLFKPFVRLENAESYPGTGLGLAIVKKAVERMIPRGPLGRRVMRNLRVYAGAEHPHAAQQPVALDIAAMNRKNVRA